MRADTLIEFRSDKRDKQKEYLKTTKHCYVLLIGSAARHSSVSLVTSIF